MELRLQKDKGVAGLSIFLSLITMLFVIGLLVMVFSLMSGGLRDASYDEGSKSVVNESGAYINSTGYTLDGASDDGARNFQIDEAYDVSNESDPVLISSSEYTVDSEGVLTNATDTTYSDVDVSYSYDYDEGTVASDSINDTNESISGATEWFPLFIIIGAMVVLILLTVIIITAIRSSGLIASGGEATA